MPSIEQARVLILATDGFEQSELAVPLERLREAGATVEVASPSGEAIRGWNETDWGDRFDVDLKLDEVDIETYDAIVLPGGQINPDKLRTDMRAVDLVRDFVEAGKVVAAICHGPWMLVEADVVQGRTLTSYHSIRTDVVNAGGDWIDREVVSDQGLVTSRSPDDLDAFVSKIVEEIEERPHAQRKAGAAPGAERRV